MDDHHQHQHHHHHQPHHYKPKRPTHQLHTVNNQKLEFICPLEIDSGRDVAIQDQNFVVTLYKRDNVDTQTLPAIEVGLPADASDADKTHYVGFFQFLGHGLNKTSLPKYAEIRLPDSHNLCIWLCPPAEPATFDATCKIKMLVPPVLLSAYTFSPISSPMPSPTARATNGGGGGAAPSPGAFRGAVSASAAAVFADVALSPPPPSLPSPAAAAAAATAGGAGTHSSPSPRHQQQHHLHDEEEDDDEVRLALPRKKKTSSFMEVDKSFLSTLSQNHVWLFGALGELLHNSCDAHAKECHINVRHEAPTSTTTNTHKHTTTNNNSTDREMEMVLELKDNGIGMSHHEMEAMFRLGKSYNTQERDINRVGRYGLGFKQGSLRIGATAIVLSKSLTHKTLSFGILSNAPHLKDGTADPICRVVTLSADTMEPHPELTSREDYLEVAELIAQHSFITKERYFSLVLNQWQPGESGTTVFLQKIEHTDPDTGRLWRELRVDRANNDLLLVNRSGKKHLNTRGALLAESVPMDHSLKAYLQLAFLEHKMQFFLLGEQVPTINVIDTLTDVHKYNLLRDDPKKTPVVAIVGKSEHHEKLGLGGGMFYCTNVLIASYVRQEIGITNPQEGRGVLAIVHLNPKEYETAHNKQQFRRPNPALEKIEDRLGKVFTKYITHSIEKQALTNTHTHGTSLLAHTHTLTNLIQCEHCGKWRVGAPEYIQKFTGKDVKWYCWSEGSPVGVGGCDTPEAALANDPQELLVKYQGGEKGSYLEAIEVCVGGGEGGGGGGGGRGEEKESGGGNGVGKSEEESSKEEKKKRKKERKDKKQKRDATEEHVHHQQETAAADTTHTHKKKKRRKEKEEEEEYHHSSNSSKHRFLLTRAHCSQIKVLGPQTNLYSTPGRGKIAFKTIALGTTDTDRQYFKDELKKLRRLSHENLLPLVAARMEELTPASVGFPYDHNLISLTSTLLKSHTAVPLLKRFLAACKVAAAIDYLHQQGVVHGALRPSNVLVTPDLRIVKLTDYGFTRRALPVTSTAAATDRIAYSPPEALGEVTFGSSSSFLPGMSSSSSSSLTTITNTHTHTPTPFAGIIDPSRDMWSMGILLCELIVGRKAWGVGKKLAELRALISNFSLSEFVGVKNLRTFMSVQEGGWKVILEGVRPLVEGCLRRKPSERIASQQLADKLSTLAARVLYGGGGEGGGGGGKGGGSGSDLSSTTGSETGGSGRVSSSSSSSSMEEGGGGGGKK